MYTYMYYLINTKSSSSTSEPNVSNTFIFRDINLNNVTNGISFKNYTLWTQFNSIDPFKVEFVSQVNNLIYVSLFI